MRFSRGMDAPLPRKDETMTANFKEDDLVRVLGETRVYRVSEIVSVFGVPAAELIRVRKNLTNAICKKAYHRSQPLSCLVKWEPE